MSKAKKFRDQSDAELKALYQDLAKELFQLRNEMKQTRKNDNAHKISFMKKDRARILTILRENELKAIS